MDEQTDDQTVLITQVFDAPRDQVFRAWTEPEQIAAWYGPEHMTAPVDQIVVDLRVGGRWELTMVPSGGGQGFSIGYDIIELSPPGLLVLRSDPMPQMGMPDPTFVRVELHDHGEKTRMTLSDGPFPPGGAMGAEHGWNAAVKSLGEHLSL